MRIKKITLLLLIININCYCQIYPRNFVNDCKTTYNLKNKVQSVEIREYKNISKKQLTKSELRTIFPPHKNLLFDINGNLIEKRTFSCKNNKLLMNTLSKYNHNKNNKVVEIKQKNKNKDIIGLKTFVYKKNEIYANENNLKYTIKILENKNSDEYEFIKDSQIAMKLIFRFKNDIIFESEEIEGSLNEKKKYDSDINKPTYYSYRNQRYKYDNKSNLIEKTSKIRNKTKKLFYEYKYDQNNNWIEKKSVNSKNKTLEIIQRKIKYY